MADVTDNEHRIDYVMERWGVSYLKAKEYVESNKPSLEEATYVLRKRCDEVILAVGNLIKAKRRRK